ncbi:hypothetical protein F5Y16DRAFT_394869 [Xylariaceae sp. FL0255]|nr:hypothetical protein F5Y16DRAFT_394869 [Xylariaceae sp. FL0255]
MNAFLLFRRDRARQYRVTHGAISHKDIAMMAASEWRNLAPAEQQVWRDQAMELTREWQRQHPNGVSSRRVGSTSGAES